MSSLSYTVFLSFCGVDTRKNIVSHLYRELAIIKGISTFKDNEGIGMGDSIFETLIEAIKNSKFAVVVISENFATSSWCLEELRLIMELEEAKKIEVIPLFYGVDPSDVRHYRGKFNVECYQNHGKAEMIPKWKEALERIADHKGGVSLNCTEEATMIEEIAERISSRALSMLRIDLKGKIFGWEDYMEVLQPLLEMEAMDEVRMIGIYGIEGIGKTTIVSRLYEQLKGQFSTHHCFIEDIGSRAKLPNGLLELQKRLVFDVISEHNVNLTNREQGARLIKERLKNLKVLLVLDNVDEGVQLHYLARQISWFGAGSRIIITTRNKSFLRAYGVRIVYDVKPLDDGKDLQLFEEIAFQGERELPPSPLPPPHHLYDDLSKSISWYAQGIPLTLINFGLSLRGKSLEQWEVALDLLDKAYQDNIKSMVKDNYESLDEFCKTVFLHVACLFNGDYVTRVKPLFNRDESWVSVLADKSLIDLSAGGIIAMPCLVEEIGKEIVRRESNNNPANQRILWNHDDIYQVVADKSGTSSTEGLAVDVGEMLGEMANCIHIEWNVFKQMHNLIFLNIYNNSGSNREDLILEKNIPVPRKIRLLDWDAYPFTALPSLFRPDFLVEINLCNSKLTNLWSGTPKLLNLRKMDLSGSKYLKKLPDLQGAVYLEELILEGCSSLKRIPKSICSLPRLQKLDVSNCYGLRNKTIKIRESETTVFQEFVRIRSLKLSLADAEPPQGISLTNLSIKGKLNIKFLQALEGSARHLCFVSEQQYIPKLLDIMRFNYYEKSGDHFKCHRFSGFPWLVELNLINLNIQEIPDDISQMVDLEKLDLSGNDFKDLPTTISDLMKLKHLTLCNCRKLEKLPELYQVETLTLSDCTNLTTLVTPLYQGSCSLLELWLDNCKNVESLSDQLSRFQKLRYLDMSRHDFETVPPSIKDLSSLVTLSLNYCDNLTSLTNLPMSLKCLKVHGCNSLEIPASSTDTCLHPNQNTSQITRFPAGRRGEEAPMCDCFGKTKTNKESDWNQILPIWQHVRPWFWCFVIGSTVVCLHSILRITGIEPFTTTTTTSTIFYIYLCTFLFAIFLHYKL